MIPNFMFRSFIVTSVALVGLSLKLDAKDNLDLLMADEDSLVQLFEALKVLEADFYKMNQERIASFPKGPVQAQVGAAGNFAFPANCNATTRIFGYPYCFHGSKVVEDEKVTIDAKVDLFDLQKAKDNTVIGLTAAYNGKTMSELEVHAGGSAEIISYGNKGTAAMTIELRAYDEELSGALGLGETTKNEFFAIPHIKIYGFGYLLADIVLERGENSKSYVFAGKPYNMGFNVSEHVEKEVKFKIKVRAALEMSLTTVKNDMDSWILKSTARVVVIPPIGPNFNFPYDYITQEIHL